MFRRAQTGLFFRTIAALAGGLVALVPGDRRDLAVPYHTVAYVQIVRSVRSGMAVSGTVRYQYSITYHLVPRYHLVLP